MRNRFFNSYIYIILIALTALTPGCTRDKNTFENNEFVDFAHLATQRITNDALSDDIHFTIARHQPQFDSMLAIMGLRNDSTDEVSTWLSSPAVNAFAYDVDSLMPSEETISGIIADIVSNAKKEHLNLPAKHYATAIWGKPQSILFADSTMFIALNHYLGKDHPSYSGLPEYRRESKTSAMMPYDIAEALVATAYPYVGGDSASVINRLVYEGAIAVAKMALVKGADVNSALGYSEEQLDKLNNNESEIWHKLVGSKMIFDRSETVADRLILPSPATSLISPECPGRAGRFIGYKIVESYLKSHKDTNLAYLLSPSFYNRSNPLVDANYNPR